MAINKKLIHFKTFANFNSLKLSANEANTKYTTGISGTETSGNPDILYQSICFIKDTQQIWTHGLIYNAPAENKGEPYIVDMYLYEDGQTGPEIEELYNNLVNVLSDNRPIYGVDSQIIGNNLIPLTASYVAGFNSVFLLAFGFADDIINKIGVAVGLLDGEYIVKIIDLEKDLSALVDLNYLATINGQSLINGGQDIIILCGGNEVHLNTTDPSEAHSIVLDAYVNNKPLTTVGRMGEKVVITRFCADELGFVIQYVDADEIFGLLGMNKIVTVTFFMEDGEYVVNTSVVPIPTNLNELEGTEGLVYKTNLATINGQSLLNGGQNITIEGGTSGVFVKFNELFAVGTLTTNESDVFNVVKTAMESNTPLLLCDNNYSIILVSYYPLKVGNTIIASGILSLNVYNFTFTSGSNQITVTELSVATLSDNLVSALGLKSPAPSTTYPSANIGMGAKPTGTYNGLVLYNAGGSNSDKDFVNIIGETHVWNTDGSIGTVFANISGNAASATALETPRTINRMTFDGSTNVSNYVVCSTESNTVPKVINIPNMVFGPDARIWIEFTNGNTYPGVLAANVTHINGTTQTVLNFYGCTGQQPTGSGNSIHYKSIVFPAGVYEFVYYNANLYFTGNYVSEKKPYIVVGSSVASANTPTIALNHTLHTVVNLSNPRALTFTVSDSSMVHDYSFEFRSGTIKPTVTFPSAWKWANGTAPTISANKTYHVSVVNNCAVIAEF